MKRDRTKEYQVREHRRKHDPWFVAKEIYTKQVARSKIHKYKVVGYTLGEFISFLRESNYKQLFNGWEASGNKKDLKPSVDRIDATKGYSFDNIQLMTWAENNEKGRNENNTTKAVLQFTKDGEFIREWPSAVDASKAIAPHLKCHRRSKIYNVLNNMVHYNTFYGYKFQYKEGLR